MTAELAAARRPNPLLVSQSDRSRNYNQFGTELLRAPTVARAEVKADVVQAMRDGTLPRSDYDDDRALVARRVQNHAAKSVVAQQRDAATPAGY